MYLRIVSGGENISCKQAVDQWRKDACNEQQPQLLFTGNVPRGIFCEQSSQKTRELRREIMQSMISVHRGACNCEGTEQLHLIIKCILKRKKHML